MLPLKNRLKKEKEIERVLKNGESYRVWPFVLKKIENNLSETRFCFIAPERNFKKAVLRNKLKRRMREIVRMVLPKIKKGFDVLVIVLAGGEKEKFADFKEKLLEILKRAKLYESF